MKVSLIGGPMDGLKVDVDGVLARNGKNGIVLRKLSAGIDGVLYTWERDENGTIISARYVETPGVTFFYESIVPKEDGLIEDP